MNGIIRVALYARVSSQRQAEDQTIDSQRHAILERIKKDGFVVGNDLEFCDDGFSGSTLYRPALETLRDRVAASLVDKVYVHTPDRLARKYAHQALLLEEFTKHDCQVIFGDHEGFLQNPETNLLVQMQGVIAEYEREKILERTRRGRRFSAASGNVSVFGRAPYGYTYIKKATSGAKTYWEIDPINSKHVQWMFQLVGVQGMSLASVCRALTSKGIKTPKGGTEWSVSTVRDILINTAYHGQARYGKQRSVARKPGKRAKRGDPAVPRQAKVTEDAELQNQIVITVPAIVSASLFEQVNITMQENKKRQRERSIGAMHLLSGLLICGECGSAFCGRRAGAYCSYRCVSSDKYRNRTRPICQNRSVNAAQLENYVWSDLCKLLTSPERLKDELERRQSESTNPALELGNLEKKISQIRGRLDRLIDAYTAGLLDRDEFEKRMVPLRDTHDRELVALTSLRGKLHETDEVGSATAVLARLSAEVGESLATASTNLKRDLMKLLIRRIEIHAEEIRLVYKVPPTAFFLQNPDSGGFLQHWLVRHDVASRL